MKKIYDLCHFEDEYFEGEPELEWDGSDLLATYNPIVLKKDLGKLKAGVETCIRLDFENFIIETIDAEGKSTCIVEFKIILEGEEDV